MMNNSDKHNNGTTDHHSDNEDDSTPEIVIIINCVLNAPLMLISILGNVLVLAAIIRTPSIRSTHMMMLCSLAVSDLLVGLIAQPIFIAKELKESRSVEHLSGMSAYSLSAVSLLTITAITVDRFLALHYHMRYATLVTESRVKYTLIIIWFISFLSSGFEVWSERLHSLIVGPGTIICLIISTFSHIKISFIVRKHQLQILAQQQAAQSSNTGSNLNIARLKRSAMNTFVFYIALIICYLPMYVLMTLYGLSIKEWETEWQFAFTAVCINSSINPC